MPDIKGAVLLYICKTCSNSPAFLHLALSVHFTAEPAKDSMQQLEAAAKVLAEEARRDPARMPGKDILFVRGGTTEDEQSLAERSRTTNPDEINIDDDEGSDDEQVEEVAVEQRSVPEEVFGDLKMSTDNP
ncbi:unnamed protein product [Ixodes pacificus]